MKILASLLVSVALCCSSPLGSDFNDQVTFPRKIYEEVMAKHPTDNLFISPYTITASLAMASLGSGGKTTQEFHDQLQLSGISQRKIATFLGGLVNCIKNKATENNVLKISNHVFVDQKYGLKADFNQLAERYFHAGASNVDFSQSDVAAEKINTLVANETENKIKDIVKSSDFGETTDVLVLNAIYFKAPLKHKFQPYNKHDFYLNKNDKVQVDMIARLGMYAVADLPDIDAKSVSIPFADTDIVFTIILPNAVDGLANTLGKLKSLNRSVTSFPSSYRPSEVILPKFKIEFDTSLVQILKQMGLKNIFSNEADLSNLVNTDLPVKVSDVKYKAYFEIDEHGGSDTNAMIVFSSEFPRITKIKVDHPFIFLISDGSLTYFVGQVVHF